MVVAGTVEALEWAPPLLFGIVSDAVGVALDLFPPCSSLVCCAMRSAKVADDHDIIVTFGVANAFGAFVEPTDNGLVHGLFCEECHHCCAHSISYHIASFA